jgi:hypothetical protein
MMNGLKLSVLAMVLLFSAGMVGQVQATTLPMDEKIVITQSQVPPECQKIKDPVKRQACLKENRK